MKAERKARSAKELDRRARFGRGIEKKEDKSCERGEMDQREVWGTGKEGAKMESKNRTERVLG